MCTLILGTRVEESALPRLLSILSPVVHSWSLFAQLIGVPSSQSTFIEAANPHPSSSYLFNCFSQSLEWWIANDHNPTYEAILAVLDPKRGQTTPLMNRDLAKQVKEFMAKEQGELLCIRATLTSYQGSLQSGDHCTWMHLHDLLIACCMAAKSCEAQCRRAQGCLVLVTPLLSSIMYSCLQDRILHITQLNL